MENSTVMENDVGGMDSVESDEEEKIGDSFICCVCLDILYKPIVLGCGHISCFWCVHKSMNLIYESTCPVCRNPYQYFPTVCWIFHFLIVKMYPKAYRRRAEEILEEEKREEAFSPEFDGNFSELDYLKKYGIQSTPTPLSLLDSKSSCEGTLFPSSPLSPALDSKSSCEGTIMTKIEEQRPDNNDQSVGNVIEFSINTIETSQTISINDVLCPACKQLLFRPAVLNCGHAYCESCISIGDNDIIMCQVCGSPHPSDPPKVCLQLSHFLDETFPKEYAVKRQIVQYEKDQTEQKPPSGSKSAKQDVISSSIGDDELPSSESGEHETELHPAVGCDTCGMYPIIGPRYRCKDCKEKVGFDLCGDCYNTKSKLPGRFSQQHTPDHSFERMRSRLTTELVKNQNLHGLMWSIMPGSLAGAFGTPHSDDEEESDDDDEDGMM